MAKASVYEEKTEKLILPILAEMQFELVDVEYVREGSTWYLRAYIDKEGGITVNDCEAVARRMNDLLDEEDFIPDSYVFEVSSPGLGRPLKKEKDYVRNMGKQVEIRTYRAIDRCKEFCGTLTAYDPDSVTIADEAGETTTFKRADIALIRQAIEF
jgi:ribosome maturation factor RimP